MSVAIEETTPTRLIEGYDALLLDAFGVLIDGQGALPGAPELIAHLNRTGHPFWVVTNDASRLPNSAAARYQALGLAIEADRVITAGSLLTHYFREHGLNGLRCAVIGPPDSEQYVAEAGGEVVPWQDAAASRVEALVVGDDGDFDFMSRMNEALSLLFRCCDAEQPLRLILPNPDLVYPAGPGRFGFTAGSIAMWFEAALAVRYPDRPRRTFTRLGKPYPAIFEEAAQRAASRRLVMVGDQLETDIRGARAFGIDAALVTFGLTGDDLGHLPPERRPTYLLRSWRL